MKFLASLSNRIFLATSVLAVIAIGAAMYVVNERVTRDAEATLQRELDNAAGLVADWRATLSDNFLLAARLIADAPHLKAAVDTDDPQTVQPLADGYQRQMRTDAFIVTDRLGRVLSATGDGAAREAPPEAVAEALAGRNAVSFRAHPAGVLEIVTVPIALEPQIIGTLSVGFLFNRRRAEQVKRATDTEIVFGIGGRVVAGTLPARELEAVAPLLSMRGASRLTLEKDEYIGLVSPLAAEPEAAGPAGPKLVVLQSRSRRLQFLSEIHTGMAATALVAVLGAVLLSFMVARTVTRPLAAITAGMREIAATGDLTRKIELPTRSSDEDARLLASTFNTLTESVARFQREAAQRERLSALGRLSTVIAHEIRNPLMIIKAAVRTLRRGSGREETVRQAAADIGEEADRLNRIVSEVLDFARPVQFTYGDADLAALCAQCAAAAAAGEDYPVVRASGVVPVPAVTDAERLRGVLVNLVTNARQAVLARRPTRPAGGGDGDGRPDVEIRAEDLGPDRVAIEVADRGVGIPPDVVQRVFEPFFSTRREGTGVGLAIARNVVDGLEGTITLTSTPGVGTRVRIELPRVPGGAGVGPAHAR